MAVSNKHILEQGPVLRTLAGTAFAALRQQIAKAPPKPMPTLPGPEVSAKIPPRSASLIRDYVRHDGGDPSAYRGVVPAHLFPQWAFGLASQTLATLPYPLVKVLNGGCRLEMRAPLPADEPLFVRGRLMGIEDDGRRAIIHQRMVTGTEALPESIVADLYAIVPTAPKPANGKNGNGHGKNGNGHSAAPAGPRKDPARVPDDAEEIARWRLAPTAGLDFAKLTGDFNPVHWVPAYARAFGFRNTILHGFSTMARAIEGLQRGLFAGSTHVISAFDCRFTRPLVLPAKIGLYVRDREVFVGDAPGGPAYLTGTYETKTESLSS
jgi:acyl dehydratase